MKNFDSMSPRLSEGPTETRGNEKTRDHGQSMLCFELAGRVFAINTTDVLIILGRQHVTPLPHCPKHVLGAFGYRGRAVGLIDLAAFLQIHSETSGHSIVPVDIDDRTIVLRASEMTAGFAVPLVRGIVKKPVKPPGPLQFCDQGRLAEFASEEWLIGDEVIIGLNAARVFSQARV